MTLFLLFAVEFFVLFLLSKTLTRSLSRFLSIQVLSFLFLPGVIIHELSHLLTAAILFVRVGEIEFTPKVTENGVKLGSVEIGRCDPIRRSIIGFAPVFAGFSLILGSIYYALQNYHTIAEWGTYVIFVILLYFVFAVSNTMFSSSKDMEGTVALIVALLIIVILLYFLGIRIPFSIFSILNSTQLQNFFKTADTFLVVPLMIDLLIIFASRKIRV